VAKAYGYVAPFLLACAPLLICAVIVGTCWPENYGNQETRILDVLKHAADVIGRDRRVSALGIGQALYEGAMYTFVFVWTPALKETLGTGDDVEHSSDYLGLVFATFMVCMMIGRYEHTPEGTFVLVIVFLAARCSSCPRNALRAHAQPCLSLFTPLQLRQLLQQAH
jgi:hypothetical protein